MYGVVNALEAVGAFVCAATGCVQADFRKGSTSREDLVELVLQAAPDIVERTDGFLLIARS